LNSGGHPFPVKKQHQLEGVVIACWFLPEKLLNVCGPGADGIEDISVK